MLANIGGQVMTTYHIKVKRKTFPEPTSEKFDPDFECWSLSTYDAGQKGYLMTVIDALFEQTDVSDYYSKSQVIDACLKFGYFGYSNYAICYFPQTNKSSLDLARD